MLDKIQKIHKYELDQLLGKTYSRAELMDFVTVGKRKQFIFNDNKVVIDRTKMQHLLIMVEKDDMVYLYL